ncbi:MAG: cyclase family protein [Solirubrobacterales bacterium]|nr:cyclase family protein [Solirubrobacterales bacterium]
MFRTIAALVIGLLIGGGAIALVKGGDDDSGEKSSATNPLGVAKVVDLSHTVDEQIPLWPGDPPMKFTTVANFKDDGYYLRKFSIGEHSATHMNAPNSFHANGVGIDHYKASDLIRKAVMIDVKDKAAADPDYAFSVDDLKAWEAENGEVPVGSVVLLNTGWTQYWRNPKKFFGLDGKGGLHFPGFDGETTKYLLDQRDIAGVGIDTHGVDPGQDETYATNTQMLAKPRIVLENLTNLDQMPATGADIVIAPLKLKDGSGSPATVTGLIP